jgi:glycosyltransferase involved in cell wall biosynthesis
LKISIAQGAFLPVPPIRGGAVERVWYGLGQAFAAKGHQVFHLSRASADFKDHEVVGGVEYARIPGYDAPKELWKLKLMDLKYSLAARRSLPEADILVTHTFWLPMLLRNSKKGRVCVNVQRIPKGQMRFYAHVARLQAVSAATKEVIIAQCPKCETITKVLPNHLDNAWFTPARNAHDRRSDLLYVGRLHPEKGIELLINALAKTKSKPKLKVVGPWDFAAGGGGEEYCTKLKEMAHGSGLTVDWVGPVYDVQGLIDFYDQANVFVYPSLAEQGETFGVAPLEAMARGCTTIVSDLACFRDFAKDGENCRVFDHRHAAEENLAMAIDEAFSQDHAHLQTEAIKTSKLFHIDRVADLYLDDFMSLCRQ